MLDTLNMFQNGQKSNKNKKKIELNKNVQKRNIHAEVR